MSSLASSLPYNIGPDYDGSARAGQHVCFAPDLQLFSPEELRWVYYLEQQLTSSHQNATQSRTFPSTAERTTATTHVLPLEPANHNGAAAKPSPLVTSSNSKDQPDAARAIIKTPSGSSPVQDPYTKLEEAWTLAQSSPIEKPQYKRSTGIKKHFHEAPVYVLVQSDLCDATNSQRFLAMVAPY